MINFLGHINLSNKPNGLSLGLYRSSSEYHPSSLLVFAAMDVEPETEIKVAINDFIVGCIEDGNWDLIDTLWFPASHTEQAGKINWKNPALHLLNPIGSPVHTVDRGYDFDASTQYLRTDFVPSADGVNYTLDDASFGFYSGDNSFGGYAMGADGSQRASMFLDSLQIQARINGTTAETIAIADTLGLFVTKRTSSSDIEVWKDGISIGASAANNSAGVPTLEMAIAASNAGPGFAGHSDRMIRFAFFGGGGIDVALLYARVQTYLYTIAAIDSEAETLFTSMTVPPSLDRKIAISDFVIGCKDDGNWTKFDALWFTAAHDEQAGKLNWKDAALYTLVAINSPTYVVDRGYDFDGTTQYINTGFTPSINGVNYTLNINSFGVYSATDVNDTSTMMGARHLSSTTQSQLIPRSSGNFIARNNANANSSVAVADSLGLFSVKRVISTEFTQWKRGSMVATGIVTSGDVTTRPFYLNALNNNNPASSFSNRRLVFSFIGGDIDIALLESRVETYLTHLGAQA